MNQPNAAGLGAGARSARAADRPLYADVIGGVTTFFTMAYIVVVNPAILSTPGTGMAFSGALTATVLIASSMTLLMGLYARLPFAVAPGMGLNAFFAFTIVLQNKVPWQTALGMVFWAGVLFLAVSATPLREKIALAIPASLRKAAAAGIGLLLTFLALFIGLSRLHADGREIVGIQGLINGLAGKFLTSIVGLIVANLFTLFEKPMVYRLMNAHHSFLNLMDTLFPRKTMEQMLEQLTPVHGQQGRRRAAPDGRMEAALARAARLSARRCS